MNDVFYKTRITDEHNLIAAREWCFKCIGFGVIGVTTPKKIVYWRNRYYTGERYVFYFKRKEDALAFHLKWGGNFYG